MTWSSRRGSVGYRPREAVLVPTGGAVELPRDFFYNKGMDDQWPMLRVDEVEFSDGSTWVDPDRPAKDR